MSKTNAIKERALLVTTAHKGVFFGYGDGKVSTADGKTSIALAKARNCLYWPQDVRGFIGLAVSGPGKGSRVGPSVSTIQLFDITSVSEVSPEATDKWEKALWA